MGACPKRVPRPVSPLLYYLWRDRYISRARCCSTFTVSIPRHPRVPPFRGGQEGGRGGCGERGGVGGAVDTPAAPHGSVGWARATAPRLQAVFWAGHVPTRVRSHRARDEHAHGIRNGGVAPDGRLRPPARTARSQRPRPPVGATSSPRRPPLCSSCPLAPRFPHPPPPIRSPPVFPRPPTPSPKRPVQHHEILHTSTHHPRERGRGGKHERQPPRP